MLSSGIIELALALYRVEVESSIARVTECSLSHAALLPTDRLIFLRQNVEALPFLNRNFTYVF